MPIFYRQNSCRYFRCFQDWLLWLGSSFLQSKRKAWHCLETQHYADKADLRVEIPLAIEIISVLCTTENIVLKSITSLQCTECKTAGRMCQAYLPWPVSPGPPTPHPQPWARSTNKLSPGIPVMAGAMALPCTQPALMTYRPASPSTRCIAMGLLEGTELKHMLPTRVWHLMGTREWGLAYPDEQ